MTPIPNPPINIFDDDYPSFLQSVSINIATQLAAASQSTVETDPKLLAEWAVLCAKEIIKLSREP